GTSDAMPLLDELPAGAIVGLDTAPLIYFIEGHADYGPVVSPFFLDRLEQGLNEAVTSVVSLGEVLVQPLAAARLDLVQRYKDLLTAGPHLTLADITRGIAEQAADLRVRYGIRLPDACQLAAALTGGATHFLTN